MEGFNLEQLQNGLPQVTYLCHKQAQRKQKALESEHVIVGDGQIVQLLELLADLVHGTSHTQTHTHTQHIISYSKTYIYTFIAPLSPALTI